MYDGMMLRLCLTLGAMLVMSCATPYQPYGLVGGSRSFEIGDADGTVFLEYAGNGYIDEFTVRKYWFRRAAEICGGAKSFDVAQHAAGSQYAGSVGVASASGGLAVGSSIPIYKPKATGYLRCRAGFSYDPNAPHVLTEEEIESHRRAQKRQAKGKVGAFNRR